jgi:transcriptional regulator with XRE-family HTH domain
VDVSTVIRQRLRELGLEQRDLAAAAKVTESYISQLLTRKKLPPAAARTDIYDKIGKFLRLPSGNLAKLAEEQRMEELKLSLGSSPAPLFKEVRELILRKCCAERQKEVQAIFEKQPFGELERFVTQKLLDVVKRAVKEELESENWLRVVARLSGRTYEQMRVILLEFLDRDAFNISADDCDAFLEPLIERWDVDLATFAMEIVLSRRLAPGNPRKFEFVESGAAQPREDEPGLKRFLKDRALSGDADDREIEFLKGLRLGDRRPTALYYYRELQNLRDPLNFKADTPEAAAMLSRGESQPRGSVAPMHRFAEAAYIERQLQFDGRKTAIERWKASKARGIGKRKPKK